MRAVRVASIQPLDQYRMWVQTGPERSRIDEMREQNLELAERLLGRAGEMGCDIACYPEDLDGIGVYLWRPDTSLFHELVEEIPGPTSERIAAVARKHHMHVIYTQYERVGDTIRNAGVLLDRQGEIQGKYYKIQLPAIERWSVTRGDSFPVFRTDFGTVGILICYDFSFPEIARSLALSGAEMLFCPTMGISTRGMCEGNGLIQVQARAMENFVPITISTCHKETMIVNNDGGLLAMARPNVEDVISAVVDLDARATDHSDWEFITATSDVRARLLQERLPEVYGMLTNPCPPALEQLREQPIRQAPEDPEAFYAERARWWAQRRGGEE